MKRYRLVLTAQADVSPAANRERGFFTPSLPYIPGGSLRGALAARWIARNGRPDDRFGNDVESLRIGPGIADGAEQRPLSVYACKYPTTDDCHDVYDDAFGERPGDGACPGCGRPLEQSKGEWIGRLRRHTATRTALSQEGTAAEGQLYSRQALTRGQRFIAAAMGDLSWLGDEPVSIRVGGQRSIAGKVMLRVEELVEPSIPPESQRLVIRLDSPAVFLADDARTSLHPQPGDIRRALRDAADGASGLAVARSWTRPDTVGGWNAAGGLPKASEVVAMAASTYVLESGSTIPSAAVAAIARNGLGVRRGDGLGWVSIQEVPWRPPDSRGGAARRKTADSDVQAVADRIDRLPDHARVRRQISGWLRDGFTRQSLPPGYAFEGLEASVRVAVEDALALAGEKRTALLMSLQARDFRDRRRGGGRPR